LHQEASTRCVGARAWDAETITTQPLFRALRRAGWRHNQIFAPLAPPRGWPCLSVLRALGALFAQAQELKNTNHRLHVANTMTHEMAASILKAQKTRGMGGEAAAAGVAGLGAGDIRSSMSIPIGTAGMLMHLAPAADPQPQQQREKRMRLTPHVAGVSVTQAAPMMPLHAHYLDPLAHKLVEKPAGSVPLGAWVMGPNGPMLIPANAPMSMWMPADAQDISQDHLLRPPVA
jgi:hypothetical protein